MPEQNQPTIDQLVGTPVETSKIPFVATPNAPTTSQVATKDVVSEMLAQGNAAVSKLATELANKPFSVTASPEEFNKALLHLADVKAYYLTFTSSVRNDGVRLPHRHGYNPFFALQQDIAPLEKRIDEGDKSKGLVELIMKLVKVEPSIENLRKQRRF